MADFKVDVDNAHLQELNDDNKEFEFHDIPYNTNYNNQVGAQTHVFHDNPDTAESEEEEFDKTELLKEKSAPSFWKFEYYQKFFDVDTYEVLDRIFGSMVPRPRTNYLKTKIRPKPDLYGPFWICTTLVFTTAIAGNLANYLQCAEQDYVWRYDFHKVTFSATAIFAYWWLIPAFLVVLLWWRKSDAGYTFLEILCVYGYSLAVYIPISILWVIQVNWLQWSLVIIGALLSGSVLLLTFWPAVRDDNKQIAWITMSLILIFHAALAAGFVLYFFHVPATKPLLQLAGTPVVMTTKVENRTNAQKQPVGANLKQVAFKAPQPDQHAQLPPVQGQLAQQGHPQMQSLHNVNIPMPQKKQNLFPANDGEHIQTRNSENNSPNAFVQNKPPLQPVRPSRNVDVNNNFKNIEQSDGLVNKFV